MQIDGSKAKRERLKDFATIFDLETSDTFTPVNCQSKSYCYGQACLKDARKEEENNYFRCYKEEWPAKLPERLYGTPNHQLVSRSTYLMEL